MRSVIFGDYNAAACFFVQTMDDAGSLFSADARQGRAVAEQRVDQSVLAVAGAWVDGEPCGLVDNDEVVVFEEDLKRNGLWPDVDLLRRRLDEINLVTGSDNLPWPTGCAVEPNEPAPDQLLKA